MFAGQATESEVAPLTVTVNEQDAVLLPESVAVQVTVVTPVGKVDPDAGLHTTEGVPRQLDAVGVA
jgi:hypothetical protein